MLTFTRWRPCLRRTQGPGCFAQHGTFLLSPRHSVVDMIDDKASFANNLSCLPVSALIAVLSVLESLGQACRTLSR